MRERRIQYTRAQYYMALGASLDRVDRLVDAAWAYELALQHSPVSVDLVLDLVAVYLTCLDAGYAMSKGLSEGFTEGAYGRANEVLDLGVRTFGDLPDFEAWSLALRQLVLGEEIPRSCFEQLAAGGSDLAAIEASLESDPRYLAQAKQVFGRSAARDTARRRYFMSFANSVRR